ncbi:MAG: PstS family phosphate ABC transporter substrate-binding protein [Isosphaeraceae bacterium]|nr:PstS family phosphate ABC transporter substrate-binding protein [Isosphaeraceae bacterium]
MSSHSSIRLASASMLLALAAFTGCGGDEPAGGPSGGPGESSGGPSTGGGTVVVDGSSTVFKISKAAQEAFARVNPDVEVVVNNSGTGGGFKNYLDGRVDIVDASRAAKSEEAAKAKAQGIDWTEFTVGYDGIAVVVNKKNDFVKSITVAQLKALYEPNSKIKTWKDLNPAWPDRKVVLYSPDANSGTHEFFSEAIIGGSAKTHRLDLQASADDNILVRGVGGDADGIGYFGYAYAVENQDKLRIVPVQVDDKAPAVAPDLKTILEKTYVPLSRPLFIYVKNSAMKRSDVGGFVKYYLENIETLVKQAGYVPPDAAAIAANQAALSGSSAPAAKTDDAKPAAAPAAAPSK